MYDHRNVELQAVQTRYADVDNVGEVSKLPVSNAILFSRNFVSFADCSVWSLNWQLYGIQRLETEGDQVISSTTLLSFTDNVRYIRVTYLSGMEVTQVCLDFAGSSCLTSRSWLPVPLAVIGTWCNWNQLCAWYKVSVLTPSQGCILLKELIMCNIEVWFKTISSGCNWAALRTPRQLRIIVINFCTYRHSWNTKFE